MDLGEGRNLDNLQVEHVGGPGFFGNPRGGNSSSTQAEMCGL